MARQQLVEHEWWITFPTVVCCYHPRDDRFFICAWVEKCAWCKAVRFTEKAYEHSAKVWMPVTVSD
jgi:hypothetical protein